MTQPVGAAIRPANLTSKEARRLVERVCASMEDARGAILELYERGGWQALGYPSWRDCVQHEFGRCQSRVYQLLDAARIERDISTMVETPIPERVLRPLARLDSKEERQQVWDEATKDSPGKAPAISRVAELVEKAKRGMSKEALADLARSAESDLLRERRETEVIEAAEARRRDVQRMQTRGGQALKIAVRLGLKDVAAAFAAAVELAEDVE